MNDLRFALRQFIKSPGFTAVAVLTLALGIGVCTTMFSIVDAVILKPLPCHEPDRLVWIENIFGGGLSGRTMRADVFNGWREQNKSFESLAAYFAFSDYGSITMTGLGDPQRLRNVAVSDNFLSTLGISLLHGRSFTADECKFNGPGAVILSYSFWQRRFAGDPGVIGRGLTLDHAPATIVGVLPREFDFASIFTPGSAVDVLTPFPLTPKTAQWGNTVFGIGRLRPGVTVDQAQAELTVISGRLQETIRNAGRFGAIVAPLDTALRGKFRSAFLLLAGAVLCVLAIACVNLSNLLLARINVRRQEFAVRFALGARRVHLVRQALIESLALAVAGSFVGIPLAIWATDWLARLPTFGVPLLRGAAVDPAALTVTLGLTALAGVGCGLLPAVYLFRSPKSNVLQNASHQRSAGRSAALARNILVVAEVALSCMLLVGAGLLLRSFNALLHVNLGFRPQHAMFWRIDRQQDFKDGAAVDGYLGGMVRRISALPGVDLVGLTDTLPLSRNRTWGAGAIGVNYPDGQYPFAEPRIIYSCYLQAMKIPLLAGRYFDEGYNPQAEKSVIINESLARQLWPGRDPLGQKISVNGESTVIGVVADVRHSSLQDAGGNEMYLDCRQSNDWGALDMVVRSSRTLESLAHEVRAALAAYDPSLPNGEFYELERLVDDNVAPRRLTTLLLGCFSTLALTLAALGLYGVIAYSVIQRTQEIGIRLAIGAQRGEILQMILMGGLKLVVLGITFGLVGSLALARVLQSQLFGISAYDPLTFAGISVLLIAIAAAACLVPACRATKVDPIVALRAN